MWFASVSLTWLLVALTSGVYAKTKSDDDTDGYGASSLADGQCYICTKEYKERPLSLTVQYFGGTGSSSGFQDADKADCRIQEFPMTTTIQIEQYGKSYQVSDGDIFTFDNGGEKMDAERSKDDESHKVSAEDGIE